MTETEIVLNERELALAQAAADAKLLAAEREHEIKELKKLLVRYEAPPDAEDDTREEQELGELLEEGNENYTNGEFALAMQTYLTTVSSLWDRYRREKIRSKARMEAEEAARAKWLEETSVKEKDLMNRVKEMEEQMERQRQELDAELEQHRATASLEIEGLRAELQQEQSKRVEQEAAFNNTLAESKAENEDLRNQLARSEESLKTAEVSISRLQAETVSLQERALAAEKRQADVTAEKEQNTDRTRQLLHKHKALKEESRKKDVQIAEMKQEIETVKAESDRLRTTLETEMVPRIAGLTANQARIEELEGQLANARALLDEEASERLAEADAAARKLDEAIVEKNEIEAKLQALAVFAEQESAKVREMTAVHEELQHQFQAEKERAQAIEIQLQGVEASFTQERHLLKARIEESEQRLKELESRLNEKEAMLAEGASAREMLNSELERLANSQTMLDDLQSKWESSQSERTRLEAELQQAQSEIQAMQAALREERAKKEASGSSLTTLQQTIEELESELASKSMDEALYLETSVQLQQALTKTSALEAELAQVRSAKTQEALDHAAPLLVASRARIDELESALASMSQSPEHSRKHEQEIESKTAEIESLKTELESARSEISNRVQAEALAQATVRTLGEELTQVAQKAKAVEMDLMTARIEMEAGRGEVSNLKTQLEQTETRLKEAQSAISVLESSVQNSSDDVKKALEVETERSNRLAQELVEERERVELLSLERDELMEEKTHLKATLDQKKQQLPTTTFEPDQQQQQQQIEQIRTLETQLSELKNRLVEDKSARIASLEANAARIHELEQQFSVANEAKALLEREMSDMKASYSTRIFELESEVTRLKDELEYARSQEASAKQVQSELDSTLNKVEELKQELAIKSSKKTDESMNEVPSGPATTEFGTSAAPRLKMRRASVDVLRSSVNAYRSRTSSFDESLSASDLIQMARAERDEALKREQDLGAECEALRRRLDDLMGEANARLKTEVLSAAKDRDEQQETSVSPRIGVASPRHAKLMISLAQDNELESQMGSTNVSSEDLLAAHKRSEELEQELRRLRAESALNVKNLQAECEALRRRVEELGFESEARTHRAASEDHVTVPNIGVRRANSNVEGQRRHPRLAALVDRNSFDFTPESQTRKETKLPPNAKEDLPKLQSFDEPNLVTSDRERTLEDELKRVRAESANTVKNLQVECEALHRKVDELMQGNEDTAEESSSSKTATTTSTLHRRSMSEVEAQRPSQAQQTAVVSEMERQVPDTPESQRHVMKRGARMRNPIRANRLVMTPPQMAELSLGEEDMDVTDTAAQMQEDLRSVRDEYSLSVKNLQSECEALRRRVNELEMQQQQQQQHHQREDDVSETRLSSPAQLQRNESALEAQREVPTTSNGVDKYDQTIQELRTESEALKHRVSELEAELAKARASAVAAEEAESLKLQMSVLEQSAAQARAEVEHLRETEARLQSLSATKDRELQEALERLQAGNETLDDLRTSLEGAHGRFHEFGDRAQTLVESIERLQAERDAMREQIEQAYGTSLEGGDLDEAVDAAHSAGDEAVTVAKRLAEELASAAGEDELATTLAEALRDAQDCLKIALQMKGEPAVLREIQSVMEAASVHAATTLAGQQQPKSVEVVVEEKKMSDLPASKLDVSEPEIQTNAGEESTERPAVAAAKTTSTRSNNDFFISRIIDLERERADLIGKLSKAEAELEMRKDLFGFVNRTFDVQLPKGGLGSNEDSFITPSKFASMFNKDATGTGLSTPVLTPWKSAAFKANFTPSVYKNQPSASFPQENNAEVAQQVDYGYGGGAAPEQQQYQGTNDDYYGGNQWHAADTAPQPTEHVVVQEHDATDVAPHAQTEYMPPPLPSASSQQQQQQWGQQQQPPTTTATHLLPAPPALPPKPNAPGSSTTQKQSLTSTAKKKSGGPSVLAIAFGIGSFHPEWKPDPKELEEYNSDFEEEEKDDANQETTASEQFQNPLPPTNLSLSSQPPQSEALSDPFAAGKVPGSSPRYQQGAPTDPFAPRQRRPSSIGSLPQQDASAKQQSAPWSMATGEEFGQPRSRVGSVERPPASDAGGWAASADDNAWPESTSTRVDEQQAHEWGQHDGATTQQWETTGNEWGASAAPTHTATTQDEWTQQQQQLPETADYTATTTNEWSVQHPQQNEWGTGSDDHQGGLEHAYEANTETKDAPLLVNEEGEEGEDDSKVDAALLTEMSQKLVEASKRNEELERELATEREARLYRESQFEFAESQLYSVAKEAEELKSKVSSLEVALSDAQQLLASYGQEKHQAQLEIPAYEETNPAEVYNPELADYQALNSEVRTLDNNYAPQTPLPAHYEFEENPAIHLPVETPVQMEHGGHEQWNEVLARKEEEFGIIKADLEVRLQEALGTIEDLRSRLEGAERMQQTLTQESAPRSMLSQSTTQASHSLNTDEVNAKVAELKTNLKNREDDVARLTEQLSLMTYSLYRARNVPASSSWLSTISSAATAFAFTALVPTDVFLANIVNLIQGE